MRAWTRGWDVAVVGAFVVAGRRTHDTGMDPVGLLETAAPFVLALGGGWWVERRIATAPAWRRGLAVGSVTAGMGSLLRRLVFGGGIAWTFVVVTGAFLVAGCVTWRVGHQVIATRRARDTSRVTSW